MKQGDLDSDKSAEGKNANKEACDIGKQDSAEQPTKRLSSTNEEPDHPRFERKLHGNMKAEELEAKGERSAPDRIRENDW